MNFWDRFIQRLFFFYRPLSPPNLNAVNKILGAAFALPGLFDLIPPLSPLSLLLIRLSCRANTYLRTEADLEFDSRKLSLPVASVSLEAALHAAETRSHAPLLSLPTRTSPTDLEQQALAIDLLTPWCRQNLYAFLGRSAAADLADTGNLIAWEEHLASAFERFFGGGAPPQTFVRSLYLSPVDLLVHATSGPVAWPPAVPPVWYLALSPPERAFLACCHSILNAEELTATFLCFYGQLDLDQVLLIMDGLAGWSTLKPGEAQDALCARAAGHLASRWLDVISCMRRRRTSTAPLPGGGGATTASEESGTITHRDPRTP